MQYRHVFATFAFAVLVSACPAEGYPPSSSLHDFAGSTPHPGDFDSGATYEPEPIDAASPVQPPVDAGAVVDAAQPEPVPDAGAIVDAGAPVDAAPIDAGPEPTPDAGAPVAGGAAPVAGAPAPPPVTNCKVEGFGPMRCDEATRQAFPTMLISWNILGTLVWANCNVLDAPACVPGADCNVWDGWSGKTRVGVCQ